MAESAVEVAAPALLFLDLAPLKHHTKLHPEAALQS